jgi:hypothetical protein
MKFLRRKIPNSSANAMWASQIRRALGQPQRPEELEDRREGHLDRDHHQRDDDQEDRVAERNWIREA